MAGEIAPLYGAGTDSTKGTTSLTGVTANVNEKGKQTYVNTNDTNAAATDSDFTVTGGTWTRVYGGYASNGEASNNTVTISGGTIKKHSVA